MSTERDAIVRALVSQLLAALKTLKECVDRCPDAEWNERHGDHPFSQVAFHALFGCDLDLSGSEEELKAQTFHADNREAFADYEDLEDRPQVRLYKRDFLARYYEFCREKAVSALEPASVADLLIPNSDYWKNMTRLERYVNCMRHTQHHAAQLGLRLQLLTGTEMEWHSRGYEQSTG